MTHIIQHGNPNLFLLNESTAVYFGAKDDFEPNDTVIIQDGRVETKYCLTTIYFQNKSFLKKDVVMLNLSLIV